MNSSQLLKAHGEKLFKTIDVAIANLEDPNTLIPILNQLGHSHYRKKVREQHFPVRKLSSYTFVEKRFKLSYFVPFQLVESPFNYKKY